MAHYIRLRNAELRQNHSSFETHEVDITIEIQNRGTSGPKKGHGDSR